MILQISREIGAARVSSHRLAPGNELTLCPNDCNDLSIYSEYYLEFFIEITEDESAFTWYMPKCVLQNGRSLMGQSQ